MESFIDQPGAETPVPQALWARLISIVFHPLVVPTYLATLLLATGPEPWGAAHSWSLGAVFLGTFVGPALTAAVLHRMRLVSAFHLPLRSDRQWPLAVTAAGMYWSFKQTVRTGQPEVLTWSLLAACVTLLLLYLALLWTKASGHTAGMAAACGAIAAVSLEWGWSPWPLLASAGLLTSVVAARLQLRAHSPTEILWGLAFGIGPIGLLLFVRG